jgi:hypothetical protein
MLSMLLTAHSPLTFLQLFTYQDIGSDYFINLIFAAFSPHSLPSISPV